MYAEIESHIMQRNILGERNDDKDETVRTKKRVVKEAFGSGSDSEGNAINVTLYCMVKHSKRSIEYFDCRNNIWESI